MRSSVPVSYPKSASANPAIISVLFQDIGKQKSIKHTLPESKNFHPVKSNRPCPPKKNKHPILVGGFDPLEKY